MESAVFFRCMRLVSCDVYRALGIPGVQYIIPGHYFRELNTVSEADRVLFPKYWQINSLLYGLNEHIFPNPDGNGFHFNVARGGVIKFNLLPPDSSAANCGVIDQNSHYSHS